MSGKRVTVQQKSAANCAQTSEERRELMERLLQIWETRPGMRLGELIASCYHVKSTLYHVKDFVMISALETFYEEQWKGIGHE
jgi:hypothetical protein